MPGSRGGALLVVSACLVSCAPPPPAGRPPLRITLFDAPHGLDPHLDSEFVSFTVSSHLYEGLTRLDPDLRVQPALAERWENPDDLHWRFRLRPGVRFHDGRPLEAEDVVESLERIRHHPRSDWTSYLSPVSAVRAIDPHTVEVVTEQPYTLLLHKLAFALIVPRGAPDVIEHPIGTGPYRLGDSPDRRRLVLRAFPSYWGGAPAESDVELVIEPSLAQALAPSRAQKADIVQALGPEDAARIAGTPGYELVTRPGITTDYLQFRLSRPPFSDLRVRRAVHLAVDREELVRVLLDGRGQPVSQLVGPTVFGHDPSLPAVARDVAAARALLAEAGYPRGFDVHLEFRAGRRVDRLLTQLSEVGIRALPRPGNWRELVERFRGDQVALYYGGAIASTGDASDLLDTLIHSSQPQRGLGENNTTGYANAQLDALIESAARQARKADRRTTLQKCLRLADEDLPVVPLVVPDDAYGVRDGVTWRPRLDGRVLAFEVHRATSP